MSIEANTHHDHPIGPTMEDGRFSTSEDVPHSGNLPEGQGRELPHDPSLEGQKTLSEVADRLRTPDSPADLDAEPKLLPEKKKLGKATKVIASIAGVATLAGAAYLGFGRKGDAEPTTQPTPSATATGPNATPNPVTPTQIRPTETAPVVPGTGNTPETPGNAADQQNEVFREADVTDKMLSLKFLEDYSLKNVDPDKLNVYKELIPDYEQVMFNHLDALTDATPKRIVDANNRNEILMDAKWSRLSDDGTTVETGLDSAEYFRDVAFSPGTTMKELSMFINPESANDKVLQAGEVASHVLENGYTYQTAMFEARQEMLRLEDFARKNPDDKFKPSDLSISDVANPAFVNPARFGDVANLDPARVPDLLGANAYIVRVYGDNGPDEVRGLVERHSADGSAVSHLKAFTVISEMTFDQKKVNGIQVTTFVAAPIDTAIIKDPVMGDSLKDVSKQNQFQLLIAAQDYFPQ